MVESQKSSFWMNVWISLFCIFAWSFAIWISYEVQKARKHAIPEYVEHHEEMHEGFGASGDRSNKWPTVRYYFMLKHPKCEACGTTKDLNVHHVLPFHEHPELELDPNNLITLCRTHHFSLGHLCVKTGKSNWGLCSNPRVREDVKEYRKASKWSP